MSGPAGSVVGWAEQLAQFATHNYVYLVWGVLLLLAVVFVAWPHVRQFFIDTRNSLVYPPAPQLPDTENEEGLRLARLAQQERLQEAAREAQAQRKNKPKKPSQKLRTPDDDYPLSPWASSGGGGGGRNVRFFRAPACNTGG